METKETLEFPVTFLNILSGTQGDCYRCPVALAALEKGIKWVSVGDLKSYFNGECYIASTETSLFITEFDCQDKFKVSQKHLGGFTAKFYKERSY